MTDPSLPDSRNSLRGTTFEGDEAWLMRAISRQLYRCPGCGGAISIGDEHLIVHYVRRSGSDYQHWHRSCAHDRIVPELRGLQTVSARETDQGSLEARGRVKPKHRRRPRRGR